MFQSSPALSSGRYDTHPGLVGRVACFNPRPPFRAGATLRAPGAAKPYYVSILARPFERALLRVIGQTRDAKGFQSSPALSSGRYMKHCPRCNNMHVSILARPFERALRHVLEHAGVVNDVSILARPFERALRTRSAPMR